MEPVLRIALGACTDLPLRVGARAGGGEMPRVSEKGVRGKETSLCLSELVEPAGGEAQVLGRRGAFSAFVFVWAFPDFPVGGFLELTGPGWGGGCACYLAASTTPPGASSPAFLRAAAAAQKAGL